MKENDKFRLTNKIAQKLIKSIKILFYDRVYIYIFVYIEYTRI